MLRNNLISLKRYSLEHYLARLHIFADGKLLFLNYPFQSKRILNDVTSPPLLVLWLKALLKIFYIKYIEKNVIKLYLE